MEQNYSTGLHDVTDEFVHMLDDNIVDIDQAPIGDYGYNEMDGGVDGHGEEEDEVVKIGEGVFDQAQAKVRARSKNYTQLELQILIKVCEAVSLDACTDTD